MALSFNKGPGIALGTMEGKETPTKGDNGRYQEQIPSFIEHSFLKTYFKYHNSTSSTHFPSLSLILTSSLKTNQSLKDQNKMYGIHVYYAFLFFKVY